jgi:hypothetical protein
MLKLATALMSAAVIWGGSAPAIVAASAPSPTDTCNNPPAELLAAIEPGWSLLRLSDLNTDDQRLWLEVRPKSCPGYAAARMRTGSGPSYIVALIDKRTAKPREQVLLLVPHGKSFVRLTLAKPTEVANPAVVWRGPPGKYHEWDGSRSIAIRNDSVVLETMEASAVLYYFARGRLQTLTTSD